MNTIIKCDCGGYAKFKHQLNQRQCRSCGKLMGKVISPKGNINFLPRRIFEGAKEMKMGMEIMKLKINEFRDMRIIPINWRD